MTDASDVVVWLPEKVDPRTRLGPFASGHDALKFVGWAAVGGLVAVAVGPVWWLPFLGVGAVVTIPPWAGAAPDRRLIAYLRWRFHPETARPGTDAYRATARSVENVLELLPGRFVAMIVTGGTPVAFLPPEARREIFQAYRSLLRSVEPGSVVTMGVEPLPTKPFLPPGAADPPNPCEREPRQGYVEMVRLLCRRRFRRRVRWLFWGGGSGSDLRQLDARVRTVQRSLQAMGVDSQRLSGADLERHLRALGWSLAPPLP